MSECFQAKKSFSGFIVFKSKIFKWPHSFLTFLWLFHPLKRAWPYIGTNLNYLHPRIIYTRFDWFWPAGSEEDFLKMSAYFYAFPIISHWKRVIPFLWTNLNPLYPRIICTKFAWIRPAGSGKEDFKKIFSVFLLFRYYLPLERGNLLPLIKPQSPSPKDDLCQVWF